VYITSSGITRESFFGGGEARHFVSPVTILHCQRLSISCAVSDLDGPPYACRVWPVVFSVSADFQNGRVSARDSLSAVRSWYRGARATRIATSRRDPQTRHTACLGLAPRNPAPSDVVRSGCKEFELGAYKHCRVTCRDGVCYPTTILQSVGECIYRKQKQKTVRRKI
jgi:hypothetical protein